MAMGGTWILVKAVAAACLLAAGSGTAADLVLLASHHGVLADGRADNRETLQAMIDKCAAAGGGRVVIDQGVVASGMISLKDRVTLEIAQGATLQCTGRKEDYPFVAEGVPSMYPERRAMIYARGREDIAVTGAGTIDGNSRAFKKRSPESARVSLIRLDDCRRVRVSGLTFANASMWTQHYLRTDDLEVSKVTVRNAMKNDDGLNIDGCHRVLVENCDIRAHDDAITLKNTSHRGCRDITVRDCRLESEKSAFKFGTESCEGFVDVTARGLDIHGGRDAIALFSVDGAKVENILVEDITVTGTLCPLVIRLGSRLRPVKGSKVEKQTGTVAGVTIRDVKATGAGRAIVLAGVPGHPVKDITLQGLDVAFAAAGDREGPDAAVVVKESDKGYPSSAMFGRLNAWGLFVRHAADITVKDMRLSHAAANPAGHKAYFENTQGVSLPADLRAASTFKPSFAGRPGRRDRATK